MKVQREEGEEAAVNDHASPERNGSQHSEQEGQRGRMWQLQPWLRFRHCRGLSSGGLKW